MSSWQPVCVYQIQSVDQNNQQGDLCHLSVPNFTTVHVCCWCCLGNPFGWWDFRQCADFVLRLHARSGKRFISAYPFKHKLFWLPWFPVDFYFKSTYKRECIPVGCVPPAAVAVQRGGGVSTRYLGTSPPGPGTPLGPGTPFPGTSPPRTSYHTPPREQNDRQV